MPPVPFEPTVGVAHVIQLAIAPVFLLSGIGALLGVMTGRLSRIIDRARRLEAAPHPEDPDGHARVMAELDVLGRRARLVNRAIALCTMSALLVATVVIALFVGAFFRSDFSPVIGVTFVAAMVALCAGLLTFLQEISHATRSLRIGVR
jgi:MFS family permease